MPDNHSPRAVDLLPIFYTGVPNLAPYQLATGKGGNPLAAGKPFINNFLPTLGDYLRLNMAVPVTPRNDPKFSTLGIVGAAVLGLTDPLYNGSTALEFIPNMDGFPNGRRLEDDVTTIELQAVSGVALAAIGLWYDDYPGGMASPVTPNLINVLSFNAGVTHNDTTFQDCFPYVQEPWRGFRGAQYAGPVNCDPVGNRLYVDASAAGGNGSSWQCAMKELSAAVMMANGTPSIKSIWVADGTYKPTTGSSRAASMLITRADLQILGGFAGNETNAADANPATNPTIISGDIGTTGDASDNSYHLFTVRNLPASANGLEIKGFTLTHGNANVPGAGNNYGGAILCYSNNEATAVNISWCRFTMNNSSSLGGAIYADKASILFAHCMFTANTAANGGAIYGFNSSSKFDKAVFAGNMASVSGGAYYGNFGKPVFSKVVFSGNSSVVEGGAVYQNQANADYFDCAFNGNSSNWSGAIHQLNNSMSMLVNTTLFNNTANNNFGAGGIFLGINNCVTSVQNSIFWKNKKAGADNVASADIKNTYGTAIMVQNSTLQANSTVPADNGTTIANNLRGVDPMFTSEASPIGGDAMWFTADDGLQLQNSSPAKNTGSNAAAAAASITEDIRDNARVACGTVDMGAYENESCGSPKINAITMDAKRQTDVAGIVANPFRNDLQVRYTGTEKCALNVYDGSGKVMTGSRNISQGITHVNAGSWNPGLYQVVLNTESGKKMIFKVMKM